MSEKEVYVILDGRESVIESIVKDAFTFGLILLSVYVSQGSAWWTFFTGLVFLLFLFGKVASFLKERRHRFGTLDGLIEWAENERRLQERSK